MRFLGAPGAGALIPMWLVMLAACHAERVETLQAQIGSLKRQVAMLNVQAELMRGVLEDLPPPTASVREDHDPPGFDPSRPLPRGAPGRSDVLLLSIDTLRADHLGAYGYERDTSAFIDELAAGGRLFEQAWSPAPWTLPTHATLLSGQLPVHHGVIEDHLRIPDDVPLLPEAFRRAGYRTFAAVSTLFVSSRYGFDRGFDRFVDFGILTKAQNNLASVDADHVFHHAQHWAQRQAPGRPLFLFLHVYDVHYNYDAPPPFDERFDRGPEWGDELYQNYWAYKQRMISSVQLEHQVAQYDEEIAFVDAMLREFVEDWREQGRDLLVIVTSDHGEEFGERGSWGHAHTLWPEQLRVPLIVNGPGVAAGRSAVRVGTEDVAPTIGGLAGVTFAGRDGHDRSGEVRGGRGPGSSVSARFASTSRFDSMVMRWHAWPYDLHVDVAHRQRMLCRLDDDPTCATNVYKQHVDEGEAMFRDMMDWLGQPWTAREAGGLEVRDGYIFADRERHNQNLDVGSGQRFAVLPGDAEVVLHRPLHRDEGPWQPLGGTVPGPRCALAYRGRFTVGNGIVVSSDDKQLLESLGYLQGDDEAPEVGPSGRRTCR